MQTTPDSFAAVRPRIIRASGMTSDRLRAYCNRCQHVQLFRHVSLQHRWHLILTLLTGGLWAVSWISAIIYARILPWRCPRCDWTLPRAVALTARAPRAHSTRPRTSPPTAP